MSDWVSMWLIFMGLLSLLTAAAYILYSGIISDISVLTGSPPIKKITIAYKFKQGPYKNCGQLFKESHCIGPRFSCIGIFYDDPKKVPGPLCRYAVGSILSEGETKADQELLERYKTSGFNLFTFPQVTHVVTTSFPLRTSLSIFLGVRRVYPRLQAYIKERRLCAHPFLEIYTKDKIHFMAPLARQADFYVPEIRQLERRLPEDSHSDTDGSGADSNSECSSGSGVLLSSSRETSLAASSAHATPVRVQEDGDYAGRSSCKEPRWDLGEGDEPLEGDSHERKDGEDPTQEWWGVVGGEE